MASDTADRLLERDALSGADKGLVAEPSRPKPHRAWARRRSGDIAPDARAKASTAAHALPAELMRLPSPNLHRPASAITEPSRPRRLI